MDRVEYLRTHTKETPEKYCAYCGKKMERKRYKHKMEDLKIFNKRKYCCRDCMKKGFVKVGINTKQTSRNAHQSAYTLAYSVLGKEKVCELCGSIKSIDIHHKDGNYQNNTPDNIMVVCRSCHMKLHNPKPKCKICGQPTKGYGYCNRHYIRYKKFGDPYMYYGKHLDEQPF